MEIKVKWGQDLVVVEILWPMIRFISGTQLEVTKAILDGHNVKEGSWLWLRAIDGFQ